MQVVSLEQLMGFNYCDSILQGSKENSGKTYNPDEIEKYLPKVKTVFNCNLVRVPIKWEAWHGNPSVAKAQLDHIVKIANDNGIFVIIDAMHHYDTSSWLVKGGSGFPRFMVEKWIKPYLRDPETQYGELEPFYNAFYGRDNNAFGFDPWDKLGDYLVDIVNAYTGRDNVIGFEIYNEPHIFSDIHYNQLGDLHTYLGQRMNSAMVNNEFLVFTRETAHGGYKRKELKEPLIVPRVPEANLMYLPHRYKSEKLDEEFEQFNGYITAWRQQGLDVTLGGLGEWAPQPPQSTNDYTAMLAFMTAFKKHRVFGTFWAMRLFNAGAGNVIMDANGNPTATEGRNFIKARKAVYGIDGGVPNVEPTNKALLAAIGIASFSALGAVLILRK